MFVGKHIKTHYVYLFSVLVGILSIQSCSTDPNHVHCLVVSDESHYIGEWLKSNGAVQDGVIETAECNRLDTKIDDSDGNKAGKVRWASCLFGPDCDEAGVF